MLISTSMLRLTWTVIEETSSSDLLTLTDTALAKMILQRITRQIMLNGDEICALYDYLGSRMSLIRDIAESRRIQRSGLLQTGLIASQPVSIHP